MVKYTQLASDSITRTSWVRNFMNGPKHASTLGLLCDGKLALVTKSKDQPHRFQDSIKLDCLQAQHLPTSESSIMAFEVSHSRSPCGDGTLNNTPSKGRSLFTCRGLRMRFPCCPSQIRTCPFSEPDATNRPSGLKHARTSDPKAAPPLKPGFTSWITSAH